MYHLSCIMYQVSAIMHHVLSIMYCVTCHTSHVKSHMSYACHMSYVICHKSYATCHMLLEERESGNLQEFASLNFLVTDFQSLSNHSGEWTAAATDHPIF